MSDYNAHMKERLTELKKEHPTLTHQQAFALASNEWTVNKNKQAKMEQKGGRKRAPTEYNKFMSHELGRQRELHPDAKQTEIFGYAVDEWNK